MSVKSPIEYITIEELKAFTQESFARYGTHDKRVEAEKVADVLIQMLEKKGILSVQAQQSFVDVIITSVFLHNLFYDESDWTTIYSARKNLLPIAEEIGISSQVTDAIFQTIEAQLGESTPIPGSRPQPNSPTDLFAHAVWFVKEFQPRV